MSSFVPYDPATQSDRLQSYKSPIKATNTTPNPLTIPKTQETAEYNPSIQRRTIKLDKTAENDKLRETRESKDLSLGNINSRYKESYSVNHGRNDSLYADNRNQIYKSQALSPQPNLTSAPMIDPEALKQLLNLQLQLQQNPNLILQTQSLLDNMHQSNVNGQGSVKTQNNNLVQTVSELEREVNGLKVENNKFKQTIKDLEYELDNTKQQLSLEKNKTENLTNELEQHQDLRDRLDEYSLEIQKLEGERDFHHKNHVELRKELYNKTNAEYQINKLKRELYYKNEEFTTIKDRCAELEAQINELLVFAEKPRNEKQNNAETFYAKKIVELENTIKKLKDEKFEIENFHNTSFDNRRGLLSEVNNHKIDKSSDNNRIAQLEIDTLKRKVETLKTENEYMKKQLESARSAKRADNFSLNGDSSDHYQQMIKTYKNEIEDLKSEIRRLKSQTSQGESSRMDDFYIKTIEEQKQRISALQQEKTALQTKIDTLNRELMEKNREVSELKHGNAFGVGDDTVDQLRDANKRMTMEIGRLQDQLRRMESFNKTSMMSSMNKDRDWNKLLK